MNKILWGNHDSKEIWLYTIENDYIKVTATNLGATLVNIFVPDKHDSAIDVILGYDTLEEYVLGNASHGATVGRYANRIANGEFVLNGERFQLPQNDGNNTLHGGNNSFSKKVWTVIDHTSTSVSMQYLSVDGENGFPGNMDVTVTFSLRDSAVEIRYAMHSDKDTVANLTNHSYFNLSGIHSRNILDTELQLFADKYTPVADDLIPTGEIWTVENTPFDFRQPKKIGTDIGNDFGGYDHNFVLENTGEQQLASIAYCPYSGVEMTMHTDMPAFQLYTANGLSETGKKGEAVGSHCGFCLETQFYPDSPNKPHFPSCILPANEHKTTTTVYKFSKR